MSASGFVDWGLAERVALALGGNGGASGAFDQGAVESACAQAVALALDYSRLRPAGELPRPELVDRAEWTRLGLGTLSFRPDRREASFSLLDQWTQLGGRLVDTAAVYNDGGSARCWASSTVASSSRSRAAATW